MDLISKRYASPFLLVDIYLRENRLDEFITELWSIYNDELAWEVWMNKVEGKTFEEFKYSIAPVPRKKINLETVISDSFNILNGFEEG